MSESNGERALLAIAALLTAVRTNDAWVTDLGADVRIDSDFLDIDAETLHWTTLVYTSEEKLGTTDGPVSAMSGRDYPVKLTVNIDVHTRGIHKMRAKQAQQIRFDVRKALSPPNSALKLDGVAVGAIAHLGNSLIEELRGSGVLGLRTQVVVSYREAWGDPSRITN